MNSLRKTMSPNAATATVSASLTKVDTSWSSLWSVVSAQPYSTMFLLVAAAWFSTTLFIGLVMKSKTKSLNGPANPSFLFGVYSQINASVDPGAIYEDWAMNYGPAFRIPGGFGSSRIVICDPKANAHFYSKETFGYVQTNLSRVFIENLVRKFWFKCIRGS